MPVPWSSLPPAFTSMDTTDGLTLVTNCGMVAPEGNSAPE
jgi:hypothetical protein